jgi:hypothetical protein
MKKILYSLMLIGMAGFYAVPVRAQNVQIPPVLNQEPAAEAVAPLVPAPVLTDAEKLQPFSGSLLMSPLEIAAIQRAMKGVVSGTATLGTFTKPVILPHRVIRLSGVVFRGQKDWVAWVNGKKVTPEKLLPEIIEIEVESTSQVRLKWYDVGLNKVISIALHPHQTYDIVTGVLLSK